MWALIASAYGVRAAACYSGVLSRRGGARAALAAQAGPANATPLLRRHAAHYSARHDHVIAPGALERPRRAVQRHVAILGVRHRFAQRLRRRVATEDNYTVGSCVFRSRTPTGTRVDRFAPALASGRKATSN